MNINLGEKWESFIEEQIKSGRYLSASEVVRDGLRLLQEKEQLLQIRLEELRREVGQGIEEIERGEGIPLDEKGLKQFMGEVKAKGRERLTKKQRRTA